ncbi:hypothetical protein KUTeg_023042 [Tegillarca granosa]|uniref:Transposase n=1 Tax=Tegillarca granosa TaxID=220873 RepID=A0ABQ9E531_TEGGR|nr:hypothetical protein KUTeg_023042 [Tegillarca granosa]
MLTSEEEDYLKSLWTNPKHPGAYAGPQKLYLIKIGLRRIKQFLSDQDSYSLHKRIQRNFKRNRVIRAIQTLKNRMYRMFTERQSYKFIDKLQDMVKSVNDTPSRPLGNVAPSSVYKDNEDEIRLNSYLIRTKTKLSPNKPLVKRKIEKSRKRRRPVFKFKINDKVRITYLRHPFRREYQKKWTGEVFKVYKRFVRDGLPVYKLRDFNDDIIHGTFMTQEMQKVNKDENTIWKIDKI